MKKRGFPKDLKFGTYLPRRRGMSYIKVDDLSSALERFMNEYFSHNTVITTSDISSSDAAYIDGEYTAYLFRNIMSALDVSDKINISITTGAHSFTIAFSKCDGAFVIKDAELIGRLVESARLSGFSVSFVGNTVTFSAELVRGKLVISALTKAEFAEILERVFFD